MSVSVNQVTLVMVKHPVKVSAVVRDTYILINTTRLHPPVCISYLLCIT